MKGKAVSIRVSGQVQGVGFRPFVWQLAREMGLRGQVWNDAQGVGIVAVGEGVEAFAEALTTRAPALARVDAVTVAPYSGAVPEGFEIAPSRGRGAETRVTPDAATCTACAAEIAAQGRRRGYAFTNCTHCGPRFSILNGLPYDRAQTTMAAFPMCPACRAEYEAPGDRRFHAQPVACPECGPRLWYEAGGAEVPGDAVSLAVACLRAGGVVAVKGIGGFHLACDASDPVVLALLRDRKHRPFKPFAVMVAEGDLAALAEVSAADMVLLRDPAAPVVVMRSRHRLPKAVAPGMDSLGVMLPYTPLHHLLLGAFGGPLVMTSGNLSGEPQVIGNAEARDKLAGFADGFLMHNREIARRLDDSVERSTPPMILRRARGRVPGTLPLPPGFEAAPQVLALGGQMKGAICLVKNGQALLGHHLGDLDDALCADEFTKALVDYRALFDHHPAVVAVDAHPGYRATQAGMAMGLPVAEVWHHHAHLAACLADNGWPLDGGKVAGIILDGTGLGPDGTLWGGEVLLGDYRGFTWQAGLRPAPLIGGDRAARAPWRNALVRLDQAGMTDWADALFADAPRDVLRQAAAKGINAPMSSSAGRLFDAVAACLGICPEAQSYEGEAAMRLEALAARCPAGQGGGYEFGQAGQMLDPTPIWAAMRDDLARGIQRGVIAQRFQTGLGLAFAGAARRLVEAGDARAVVVSGGCFQNVGLLGAVLWGLGDTPVLTHQSVPANDGGLALGQAMIAAARVMGGAERA
ncbi:carbamoyltransferase HypF [Pseudotabrizicola alkalilacus]|uniref:Carbamoyltransferase HypF n=1 Tax=Pseudotabrizicola alkalilacus TaxID=2305252 RepID=A0A411Z635_9RHOB|nr:carbamoyltransferase HypF [Pseudotabrizicola alkalilacus]RGP38509.1 carbamoyltransferase HypF [Pseudotabrizicola alkalilacus]